MDVFRTIIVPAAHVDLARDISTSFGAAYAENYRTGLSPDGNEPATHFVTTGYLGWGYVRSLPLRVYEWRYDPDTPEIPGAWVQTSITEGDAASVYAWCAQEQFTPNPDDPEGPPVSTGPRVVCTLQQVADLFDACDVTEEEPFVALARLGLQIVQPEDMGLLAPEWVGNVGLIA